MPLYVYECPQCKKTEERLFSNRIVADHELIVCDCIPEPGGQFVMKRVIAPTTFILKGEGWAKDGYSKIGGSGV